VCPTWEQWAEIRRLHFIDKVGIRELARRFGVQRKTIRRAIRSADPPKYSRPRRPSKLDPFTDEIHRQLNDDPRLPVRSLGAGTLDPGRIRPNAPRVRRHLHALLVATASIAKAASVDPGTVVRTSRRFGFEGFESLKLAAARASGAKTPVPVADDGPALTEEAALVRRSMLGDAQHVNADVIGLDRSGWQVELATEDCNDEGVAAYEAPHVERLRRFCALDALVEWPNFHGGLIDALAFLARLLPAPTLTVPCAFRPAR